MIKALTNEEWEQLRAMLARTNIQSLLAPTLHLLKQARNGPAFVSPSIACRYDAAARYTERAIVELEA